jgi:hypothetical protein
MRNGEMTRNGKVVRTTAALIAACGLAFPLLTGCATKPAPQKPTASQRQDAALRDPFRYKPDFTGTDVSGGDTAHLDKEGLKRDLDHVLNP